MNFNGVVILTNLYLVVAAVALLALNIYQKQVVKVAVLSTVTAVVVGGICLSLH